MSGVPGDPDNYVPVLPVIFDDPTVQALISAAKRSTHGWPWYFITTFPHEEHAVYPVDLETSPGLEHP